MISHTINRHFCILEALEYCFRLGIHLSVLAHRSDIIAIGYRPVGKLYAQSLAASCLGPVVYRQCAYSLSVKREEGRIHIGITCIVHMSVLINVAVAYLVRADLAHSGRHCESRDVEAMRLVKIQTELEVAYLNKRTRLGVYERPYCHSSADGAPILLERIAA